MCWSSQARERAFGSKGFVSAIDKFEMTFVGSHGQVARLPTATRTERMQRVLELLETRDSVHVSELADEFAVSEVTVRHDLSELARQGLVARVRGGVRGLQRGQSELAFDVRLHLQSPEKRAIARAAAAMVGDGESVALDSSTTAYYLALELRKKREIVVVTNGLLNAVALADSPGVNVLVDRRHVPPPGDVRRRRSGRRRPARYAHRQGLPRRSRASASIAVCIDLNPEEVQIKREMAAACEKRHRDLRQHEVASKRAALVRSPPDGVDAIVTDSGAPADARPGVARARCRRHDRRPRARAAAPRTPSRAASRDGRSARSSVFGADDVTTMAAVDLGAQSGRVARGHARRRPPFGRRGAPLPERPCTSARHALLGRPSVCTRRSSTDWRPPAPARRRRLRGRRLVGRRLRASRPRRSARSRTPSTTATAAPTARWRRSSPRSRRARSTSAPASSSCRSTRSSSSSPRSRQTSASLEIAETLLLIPDLLHFWLSGVAACEYTNATTTQCLDPRAQAWATDLLERLRLPAGVFPERRPPGHGPRRPPRRGGRADTPAPRGRGCPGDTRHGVRRRRRSVPQRGSRCTSAQERGHSSAWSSTGRSSTTSRSPRTSPTRAGSTAQFACCGTSTVSGSSTSVGAHGPPRARRSASTSSFALAEAAPALVSLIDPDDAASRPRGDAGTHSRLLCARPASPMPEAPGAVIRCVLESLALKYGYTIELLARVTGTSPPEVHIVGGGARNALLCRWTADATGLPVLAGPEEATVVGNLLGQAIALGEIALARGGARRRSRLLRADALRADSARGVGRRRTRASRRSSACPSAMRARGSRPMSATTAICSAPIPAPREPLGRPSAAAGLSGVDERRLPLEPPRRRPRACKSRRRQHLREGDHRRPRRPRDAYALGEGLGHGSRDDHGGRLRRPSARRGPAARGARRDGRRGDGRATSLRCALAPDQPRPSIETLLHAFLPAAHVDHTHPDAVIALTACPDGRALARATFGDEAVWLDYERPGFQMSKRIARAASREPERPRRAAREARPRDLGRVERGGATSRRSSSSVGAARALEAAGSGRFGLGGAEGASARRCRGRRAAGRSRCRRSAARCSRRQTGSSCRSTGAPRRSRLRRPPERPRSARSAHRARTT